MIPNTARASLDVPLRLGTEWYAKFMQTGKLQELLGLNLTPCSAHHREILPQSH